MELPNKQLSKILNSSNRILLTGAQNPSIDILSSAAAWWVFLQMQSKQVDVIFDGQISKLKLRYWTIILSVIIMMILFFFDGNPEDFIYFRF